MYLNASLLSEELGKSYRLEFHGASRSDGHLAPPLLYYPGLRLEPDHIYVARACELAEAEPPADCCVVSIGTPARSFLRGSTACLVLDEALEPGRVLNDIQLISERLSRWESELDEMVGENCSISDFLWRCQTMFPGQYLLAIDSNRRVLGTTSEPDYVMDQTGHTPISVVNIFKSNPEYVRMQSHRGTYLYHDPSFDHDILINNIFINDEFLGNFSLTGKDTPISPGRQLLFSRLTPLYTRLYRQQFFGSGAVEANPISAFSKMLRGEPCPDGKLSGLLQSIGWRADDEYVVSLIELHENERAVRAANYLIQQLEMLLSYALPLEFGGDVVIVMNVSRDSMKAERSKESFHDFLLKSGLCAGVSESFHSISELKNYYLQAKEALRLGAELGVGCCHHFGDYILPYMLGRLYGEISAPSLCPPGLLELRRLDEQRGSAYLRTLDTWFRTGCNSAEASRQLYINRSTFLARMRKIERMLALSLDEHDARLYLMLCLKLLGL